MPRRPCFSKPSAACAPSWVHAAMSSPPNLNRSFCVNLKPKRSTASSGGSACAGAWAAAWVGKERKRTALANRSQLRTNLPGITWTRFYPLLAVGGRDLHRSFGRWLLGEGARVRLSVHVDELCGVDVCVALRRAQARVTEQLLNGAQVGAALQQMRGKRMTKRMRTDAQAAAAQRHIAPHQAVYAPAAQARAAIVDEQRIAARVSPFAICNSRFAFHVLCSFFVLLYSTSEKYGLAILHPGANRRLGTLVERQHALLAAFPHHPQHAARQVQILEIDADQLAQSQS